MPEVKAEDFLNEPDVKPLRSEVGGKTVYVQVLTAAERDYCYELEINTLQRKSRLVEVGIVDAQGEPIFTIDQATQLMNKRSSVAEKMVSLIVKHNNVNGDPDPVGNES